MEPVQRKTAAAFHELRNLIKQSNVTLICTTMILLILWSGTRSWLQMILSM